MAILPALEALERIGLRCRAADLDDRDVRLAASGRRRARTLPCGRQAGIAVAGRHSRRPLRGDLWRRPAADAAPFLVFALRPPRLRRLDPRRLPLLLRVVGRPRGVALALRLVAGAQLQDGV